MQSLADGFPCVAVGFSPAPALAELAEHLAWRGPFLSDPDRRLYARLGVLRYTFAGRRPRIARRRTSPRGGASVTEDIRQLGADAVVQDGIVVRRWLPRTPSDRVSAATLVSAATPR